MGGVGKRVYGGGAGKKKMRLAAVVDKKIRFGAIIPIVTVLVKIQ